MTSESHTVPDADASTKHNSVELPRPTIAPMVLALGMVLLASGLVLGVAFLLVGLVILAIGLGLWVAELRPGHGHVHEPLVEPGQRPRPVTPIAGTVERLRTGMPGYRLRLPEQVHPISAGLRGGILGGLVIPIPAILWGLFSGHGIWYPINLLAGMMLPGVGDMTIEELEQFRVGLFITAILIHAVTSVVIGMIYGVLLPTLPEVPKAVSWGGLLMPLLWTAASFALMAAANPLLYRGIDWPWFIASQFVFGLVSASVVLGVQGRLRLIPAGILGGIAGGLLMPIPALLWSFLSGHGFWYPLNLLVGLVLPGVGKLSLAELEQFHGEWLAVGVCIHAALSVCFGLAYGLVLPKVPPIPGPLAWGGLVMPLLWTGASYGLMGVVNPTLQQRVSWPWFVVSQFIFGVAAAVVILRSEMVYIPPAGRGQDRVADFVEGSGEHRP